MKFKKVTETKKLCENLITELKIEYDYELKSTINKALD